MHAGGFPTRRQLAIALAALLVAPLALASDPAHEDLSLVQFFEEQTVRFTTGKVNEIRAPLLIRPAFAPPGGSFPAELALPPGAGTMTLWLQRGATECALTATHTATGRSVAWADTPQLQVTHLSLTVPASCPPGLYNLVLRVNVPFGQLTTRQINAVKVMTTARYAELASGASHPRFVVLADPQIGDPRAFQAAAQEGEAERIVPILDGTVGDGGPGPNGRWKAVRHALALAKAQQPDFVLVAGDLGYGQLVPGSYAVEYEEIWRVLASADVPLFVAPGDHDGYFSNGQDGFAYWHAYLGPTYTLAPSVPGTHILILNTYDWSGLDRAGASHGVTTWGGQVRETQLAWAQSALTTLRASAPDTRILALSHHSPSWRQDPFSPLADGIPVAEQVERGAVTLATSDQGWMGRNRLELRDLLRAAGVEVAFAGHTHRDRVARDDGEGGIIGTMQKAISAGFDPLMLHAWTRDDAIIPGATQRELADLVRAPSGPLYLDTTTTMSETDQYWGYRIVTMEYDERGTLDLAKLGHPMTHAGLHALAHHPERYNASHAELGLFSTPLHMG